MTDYAQGTGAGATGPGDGRTNPVRVRRNTLDAQDREALSSVICRCNAMPSEFYRHTTIPYKSMPCVARKMQNQG